MALTVPEFSRLLAKLNQTKSKESDKALYEFCKDLLVDVKNFSDAAAFAINNNPAISLVNKPFLLAGDPLPQLPLGRDLLAGTGITFDDSVTHERTISASASAGVPYFIADGDTFTVPEFIQALFTIIIDVEGLLVVDGFLVWVD